MNLAVILQSLLQISALGVELAGVAQRAQAGEEISAQEWADLQLKLDKANHTWEDAT